MDKDVKEIVKELIAEVLDVDPAQIEDETAIGDIPAWDSLHHVKIISSIEERFGIRFTPDILIDLEDVSDIAQAVEERTR